MVYVEMPLILGTDTQERGKARPSPPDRRGILRLAPAFLHSRSNPGCQLAPGALLEQKRRWMGRASPRGPLFLLLSVLSMGHQA